MVETRESRQVLLQPDETGRRRVSTAESAKIAGDSGVAMFNADEGAQYRTARWILAAAAASRVVAAIDTVRTPRARTNCMMDQALQA
jgi:hypothetical protein